MRIMMQPVSENSAWIRRGYEDELKGWPRDIFTVPERFRHSYRLGRNRARASRVEG